MSGKNGLWRRPFHRPSDGPPFPLRGAGVGYLPAPWVAKAIARATLMVKTSPCVAFQSA